MSGHAPTGQLKELSLSTPTERKRIQHLPVEMITAICIYLPNSAIKNLRLTCSFFLATARLRLSRVFLSANPRNIEVFLAVTNHNIFRTQVTEIIWDDTLLAEGARRMGSPEYDGYGFELALESYEELEFDDRETDNDEGDGTETDDTDSAVESSSDADSDHHDSDDGENDDEESDDGYESETPCPEWFAFFYDQNLEDIDDHVPDQPDWKSLGMEQPLDLELCWHYYQILLEQQQDVLRSNTLQQILAIGIDRFPALQRITITAAAHGALFSPVYETPMIRAFPTGFNYPIPPGWLTTTGYFEPIDWNEDGREWLGFRIAMRVLAEHKDSTRITEVCVEACQLITGLNAHIFDAPCPAYTDFAAVLARPTFRVLDLRLIVSWGQDSNACRNGLLGRALAGAAGAQGLEHLSLSAHTDVEKMAQNFTDRGYERMNESYVPLQTIFPPPSLANLRHFSLSRWFVQQQDLLGLLAELPTTLRTIDLSFLAFIQGNYGSMLTQMRDTLGWVDRDVPPKLSIGISQTIGPCPVTVWVDNEVDTFLYRGGENSFMENPSPGSFKVREGFGILKYLCGAVVT